MKKVFGGINLTWTKIIIMSVIIAIYTAASLVIPFTKDTSFSDLGTTFEMWIFMGIFIIMNSKSSKDSALKCFIFFLISQPLIYLFQVPFSDLGWQLLNYYKYWAIWTVLCLPMGYIGYYMKKDKWWGLLILFPMLLLLGNQYNYHLYKIIFAFPRHLLTILFCLSSFVCYPLFIFKNKKIKITGLIISAIIVIVFTILNFTNKPVYSTDVLFDSEKNPFDNTCSVTIEDSTIGTLSITYIDNIKSYSVHGEFVKEGNTTFVLTCPNGYKKEFDLKVKQTTYETKEREDE